MAEDVAVWVEQVPGVLAQELDDELLLLAPGSSDALHLNAVAAVIWRLSEEGPTVEALVEALTQVYGISSDRAREDLEPVLGLLETHGALRRHAPA